MSLTKHQRHAAYAKGSVAVTAGAGTGKTHMLSERFLFHLREQKISPLEIVAVTFTEKAALELRSRIRQLVSQALPNQPEIVAELEAAQISTIHALAARICREHADAAGVVPDFKILDGIEGTIWQFEQLDIVLDQLPLEFYQKLSFTKMKGALECFLDDPLTAEQALAVNSTHWSEMVQKFRLQALEKLINHSNWLEAKNILQSYSGAAGDKLEENRLITVSAIAQIENGATVTEALREIKQINLRSKGQKDNWRNGGKAEIFEALKAIRDLVTDSLKAGLIGLELSEVDQKLADLLPVLREAFQFMQKSFTAAKRQYRVLTFSDLEVHALRALQHESVREHYAKRWKVFLVDEFQDTNPVQAKLLKALNQQTYLTIVGDVKQSIYGFRRADVNVFQRFCRQILDEGGDEVALDLSFRTHVALLDTVNDIFQPILGDLHQSLDAHRREQPHPAPHLKVYVIDAESNVSKAQRSQAEAFHIAQMLKALIDAKTLIHDKNTKQLRPVAYKDIAILSRARATLEIYSDALAAVEIPAIEAGGGNLLETRPAKDAIALLRFLADPEDELALIAVLRSPFFAVSDRALFTLAQEYSELSWWQRIQKSNAPELGNPVKVLGKLLRVREAEAPTRLLQLADQWTGYTAVLANLPGAERRIADWQGIREFVRTLEAGTIDLFSTVRRCKQLIDAEVEVPRLPLQGENAVSLMTIHASKGLEWAIVVVPDVSRQDSASRASVLFDPAFGVALKLEDEQGEKQETALFTCLQHLQKQREAEEEKRILYVALTRARDQLILSATGEKGDRWNTLKAGLEQAGISVEPIPFTPEAAIPPEPPIPPPASEPTLMLLNSMGSGLTELPVTALSEYAQCPKRFQFRFVLGHPGMGQGSTYARRIGTLTHKALELNIREFETLAQFDSTLPDPAVSTALALAQRFDQVPEFAAFKELSRAKEQPIRIQVGKLVLNGVIDLVGEDWILDFKTDQEMNAEHHRFQLWAYATALDRSTAHIAYLQHDQLYTFDASALNEITPQAEILVNGLLGGRYPAQASLQHCNGCPYAEICDQRYEQAIAESPTLL